MSFPTGESIRSSTDSDSLITCPSSAKQNDSVSNSNSTQPSCSPASGQQTSEIRTRTKREVYKYETNWLVSTVAWSTGQQESFELAVGSFIEDYRNQIHVVELSKDSYDEEITINQSFEHPYPPTKILWIPRDPDGISPTPRLLATSAGHLRIWRIPPNKSDSERRQVNELSNFNNEEKCNPVPKVSDEVKLECSLSPAEKAKCRAPLTSFDWNEIDNRIIVTSSVDTTCTVWDLEIGKPIDSSGQISRLRPCDISCRLSNLLLAHSHEVFDVSFSRHGSGRDIFVTAGGDGSLRLFDLRMLSTSTVLYETRDNSEPDLGPTGGALVRVACNKQDSNYVSTFSTDSKDIVLIDLRKTESPVSLLSSHNENLNGISWAPHSAHHLSSASDDCQALIWDLSNSEKSTEEPLLAYRASGKINAINWSSSHPDWIAIGFENNLELLRV